MEEDAEKITWEAPEFIYHPKTVTWYWVSILLTLFFLAFAIYQQNFLFIVFVVVAEILFIVWSRELPQMVQFSVEKDGVRIGEKYFHPFEEITAFSIYDHAHGSELVLRRKNRITPHVKVPLTNEHVEIVEIFLRERLPQKDHEDSLIDSLFHLIRF